MSAARPRPTSREPLPAWPIPVLLLGVLGIAAVVAMFALESRRLVTHGRIAEGEVVDIDYFGSDSGIPVVAFEAEDRSVRVRLANPLGRGYRDGQRVQVRFDPSDPERARQNDFAGLWAQVMIASGVGIALLAATVVFAALRRRSLPARPTPTG